MTILRSLFVLALCTLSGCMSTAWVGAPRDVDADLDVGAVREGSGIAATSPNDPPVEQVALFQGLGAEAADATKAIPDNDDAVLRELQKIGAVDPTAAQQLVEELQTVKPSLRPLAAQQFRSEWQYRRELAAESAPTSEHSQTKHTPNEPLVPFVEPATADEPTASIDYDPADYESLPVVAQPTRLPATPIAVTAPEEEETTPTSYTELPRQLPPITDEAPRSAYSAGQDPQRTWREALDEAATKLANDTTDDPSNTSEAYQHARLRLLNLVSGKNESALEPIPGLTPTEQSYWSNQLFALATLLDHQEQPNDGQRAALASGQLADALNKLSELSALSVRNLAFCKQVFGYGDYDSLEKAVFKPGQSVTLYAEMENYRSESTEKGYHTSLATSYEVLDQSGNRVEGGEFATVDDYCKRRRRDFYMEFTFDLPSRIYANRYQLRLMIRDRLSGKIGKATIDFEIKE